MVTRITLRIILNDVAVPMTIQRVIYVVCVLWDVHAVHRHVVWADYVKRINVYTIHTT